MKSTISHFFCIGTLSIIVGLISPIPANSATLSFSFTDPAGDFSTFPNPADFPSITDIVKVAIVFDTKTGDYKAVLTSTNERPFLGAFEPNFQYYNFDATPFTVDPTIVRDRLGDNSFFISTPTTEFIYYGNNPNYMSWKVGDRVATSIGFYDSPFAGPSDWPTTDGLASNFYIFNAAYGSASDVLPLSEVAIISAVPIPAAAWLFGSGLAVLGWMSRRKRAA